MKDRSARRVRSAGRDGESFLLDAPTAHKLKSVLRLSVGDAITVVDDAGLAFSCRIASLDSGHARATIAEPEARPLAVPVSLTLGLAVIKGERMDWAIEKVSEVGVARILPILCGRSPAREISDAKRERWARIADAAALQCSRSHPAEILAPAASVEDALGSYSTSWYGDARGKSRTELQESADRPSPELLLVGPEGGWTEEERSLLEARSLPVNLGSFVLRTETAAIALSLLGIQFISNRHKSL